MTIYRLNTKTIEIKNAVSVITKMQPATLPSDFDLKDEVFDDYISDSR